MSWIARVVVVGSIVVSAGCGSDTSPADQMTPPTLPPTTTASPTPSPSADAAE